MPFCCLGAALQPLLLLYCEGRTAHTVVQRGDFPRIPNEVREGEFTWSLGFRV